MNLKKLSCELKTVTEGLGFEYVGLESVKEGGEKILRLYADRDGGISLDDCEKIAEAANAFLDEVADEIDGSYLFEVSSPGIERPLFEIEDYQRFVGRLANVRLKKVLDGRRRMQAVIAGTEDGTILFSLDGATVAVPLDDVMSARLVYVEVKGQKKTFKKTGGKK